MKIVLAILLYGFVGAILLFFIGSLLYGAIISPMIDAIKDKKNTKELMKPVIKRIIILIVVLLIISWYPFFVSTKDGTEICHNIYGIEMKCR